MRQIVLLFVALSAVLQTWAGNKESITLVTGTMEKENLQSVILLEVTDGRKVVHTSTKPEKGKDFSFALQSAKEGFYYISDQQQRTFTRIYLKPGEQLDIRIDGKGYNIKKGSLENRLLQEWHQLSFPVTEPSLNWMKASIAYPEFFQRLETLLPSAKAFKARIATANRNFNALMKLAVDADIEHAAISFLLTPKSSHPSRNELPPYYATIIQPAKFKSAAILELGEGVEILNRYAVFANMADSQKVANEDYWESSINRFGNDTLRGWYMVNSLRQFKTYEAIEEAVKPFRQYLLTDSINAVYFRALKAVSNYRKGTSAYNFSYPDITGKKVSMADLKGSIVLVDVWATWCGPCKAEIPHLKELEKYFHGKKVAFVSVSVDKEKDKAKWEQMVAAESLTGIQLFAGSPNSLSQFYNINSIPRFLLFDEEGKIISIDAPRPSSPELKTTIESLVKALQ